MSPRSTLSKKRPLIPIDPNIVEDLHAQLVILLPQARKNHISESLVLFKPVSDHGRKARHLPSTHTACKVLNIVIKYALKFAALHCSRQSYQCRAQALYAQQSRFLCKARCMMKTTEGKVECGRCVLIPFLHQVSPFLKFHCLATMVRRQCISTSV